MSRRCSTPPPPAPIRYLPGAPAVTGSGLRDIDEHRDYGVRINNPHVYVVEDGEAGGDLPAEVLAVKARFDPLALLNPGKLRGWPVAL